MPPPTRSDTVRSPFVGGRETVESIVVAFALALLFRAFEAEAFVIPTGSMAPTLMGRHKDLACPACGATFQVGASQEWDEAAGRLRPDRLVPAATCFNCGHETPLAQQPGRPDPRYPSFNGDRILVDKFTYDFRAPERWDVTVFKYPEDAKTNYIKRLVGLPGETVFLAGGDIWTATGDAEPAIARKPPKTLRAMLQCVHDADRVAAPLVQAGWPTAWTDWSADPAAAGRWTTDDDGRSFTASCPAGSWAELRFRHVVPSADDWRAILGGGRPRPAVPTPIVDAQAYNTTPARLHPVGDLAVELRAESRGDAGTLELDLVEAGERHTLALDLADGTARIAVPGADVATGRTAVRGRGAWQICFANVDDELSLFVDGRRIEFDAPTAWRRAMPTAAAEPAVAPTTPGSREPSDLAPAGVRLSGGDVRLSALRVLRDVYYVPMVDVARDGLPIEEPVLEFPLGDGEYFMLGDNSAASKDSRLWLDGHHVDRRLLVGKALVVFWPHAVPASWSVPLRFRGWDLRLPSWPNFGRMRFVR
jgi:signal peptidase I